MAGSRNTLLAIAVAPTGTPPPPFIVNPNLNEAGFSGLTWQTIASGISLGAFTEFEEMVTTDLIDGPAEKTKGALNAGSAPVTFFRRKNDAGQIALITAGEEEEDFDYGFRLTIQDRANTGDSRTVIYAAAKVARVQLNEVGPNDVFQLSTTLELTGIPIRSTDA